MMRIPTLCSCLLYQLDISNTSNNVVSFTASESSGLTTSGAFSEWCNYCCKSGRFLISFI